MSGKRVLCAGGCGRMLYSGPGSLPEGQRTCQPCRRGQPAPYGRRTRVCACGRPFTPNDHPSQGREQLSCSTGCAAQARPRSPNGRFTALA